MIGFKQIEFFDHSWVQAGESAQDIGSYYFRVDRK